MIERELSTINEPLVVVSSLAVGADQLVARLALRRKASIHAVLPFSDIERTFSASDVEGFRDLARQSFVEVLSVRGSDEDAYWAAGKRIVDLCDKLLAIWDGNPARGKGGTADVVHYAAARGRPITHVNPVTRSIARS